MNPEELELLKKTAALAEQNNAILLKMQKSSRLTRDFKIGYWILIIFLSVFGVWGFQIYLSSIQDAYSGAGLTNGSSSGSGTAGNSSSISSLLNSL